MEFKDKQAIYLQIADVICENILAKKWNEEDKIPSIRDMAIEIEVNPNTVLRTYSWLQDQSIIYNKRGIGYFVASGGYLKTMEVVRKNFIDNELPALFRTMSLINITIDDIVLLYKQKHNEKQ
jgi:GntR family transcriptional regulator